MDNGREEDGCVCTIVRLTEPYLHLCALRGAGPARVGRGPQGQRPTLVPGRRRRLRRRLDAGVSAITVAKGYRLLKAIRNTATDDGLIRRNPCRIKGASVERSPERPVLTVRQVFDLAEAVGVRYRALILLAVFGGLRWGELAALRCCDVDLEAGTVRVFRQLAEQRGGGLTIGPPKSDAGKRVVVIPDVIMRAIRQHMSWVAQPGEETLVFATATGRADATQQLPATSLAPSSAPSWAVDDPLP
jgi:integrase